MATYFGEVVFPSSRAFWFDDDEEEFTDDLQNNIGLTVQWLKDKPTNIKTLIVVEGDTITEFTKDSLCQDCEKVCIVKSEQEKEVSSIYRINDNSYICIILHSFNVKYAGEFVGMMSDILLITEKTIGITCKHMSHFKNVDVPSVPSFLRVLYTKKAGEICKPQETLLEQPNILFGVTAGVLSYAESKNLPSVLYVLYLDSFTLDSRAAEPLIALFSTITNTPIHDVTFAGKNFFNKGNLYM